ncbi:hypothetical protein ICN42_10885 [Polynucleobacter sp. 71A-WALBACH]|nr:hypothetical protein [Polynucleobacter sp. 71A-WALBACH]
MLTSALVLITMLPLQVSPSGKSSLLISRPLAVAVFVDSARILGLPKFRLRDGNGNIYNPHKAMIQEPLALIHQHAGMLIVSDVTARKAYINSYVRSR